MSENAPQNPVAAPIAVKKPLAPGAAPEGQYTRRDFLTLLGWGWLSAALGGWLLASLRFMFPNMLYEPNPVFKAGKPTEYPLDGGKSAVSDRWQDAQRVWLVSTPEGMYAFEAKCTHLGCTPRWIKDDQRFKCPCHGSNFDIAGDVKAGPAPIPLYRLAITLTQDGQIQINKALRDNMVANRADEKFFLKRSRYA